MDRIRRGKSFAGVLSYALKPTPHHLQMPFVIGGNVPSVTADELAMEFGRTSQLRPDVAKAVWHNSLRLPYKETLSTQKWTEIADDYMKKMGFSSTHLRTYVLHDDEAGQHIHIIASRIDMADGKLYLGRNENLISTRIIQELERDYRLTRTKGPRESTPANNSTQKPTENTIPKPRKLSRNEQQMQERQGKPAHKSIIQSVLDNILVNKPTITEFVQSLLAQNIRAIPNIASTGKMNGFSLECEGIAFKASQLGKGYSWSALQERINYQPERDNPYLFTLKNPAVAEVIEAVAVELVNEEELPDLAVTEAETQNLSEPLLSPTSAAAITDTTDIPPEQTQNEGTDPYSSTGSSKENHYQGHLKLRWLSWIPYLDTFRELLKGLGYSLLRATTPEKFIAKVQTIHEDIIAEQTESKGIQP